ncbi:hypothetical protein ACFLSJ_05120 [Verrucomicrobiota bacterium]
MKQSSRLDFAWAEKRWNDPLTGTEVIRLSPGRKSHFRSPYFRINMFTDDGQWTVLCEFEGIEDGREVGDKGLVAVNLVTGEERDLGPVLGNRTSWNCYSAMRHSHRAVVLNSTDPERWAVDIIDIDTGERRSVVPRRPLPTIQDPGVWADERHLYTPVATEKAGLARTMHPNDARKMMAAQPGLQDMVRIDLESGEVETVFQATDWWMGHPNAHPVDPDLFMCCQEWYGEDPDSEWGAAKEHERVRVFDIEARQWLDIFRTTPFHCPHEHWAPRGRRIYGHSGLLGCHAINRIDLEAGTNTWFVGQKGTARSHHVYIAPDESFLVGDGMNFDRHCVSEDVRKRAESLVTDDLFGAGIKREITLPSGGETIWKYVLPENSLWDYERFKDDPDALVATIGAEPERAIDVTPICRFRSMQRTLMFGYRLESNAHVMPDSRWAVFQSSSEDDWFEVWAARMPR